METKSRSNLRRKICEHKTIITVVFVAVLLFSLFLILNENRSEDNDDSLRTDVYGIQSNTPMIYNGEEQRGFVSDNWYTLSGDILAVEVGDYTVIATLVDPANTKWTDGTTEPKEIVWSIAPKMINVNMVLQIDSIPYTGHAVTPDILIYDNESLLFVNKDYTISYLKNINVGTGTVVIIGVGNYCRTVEKSFSITYKPIEVLLGSNNLIYNGLEQNYVKSSEWYTLADNKGIDAGYYTATATLTDPNTRWEDSSGSPKIITWNIKPKSLTFNMVKTVSGQDYSGEDLIPAIFVNDGDIQLIINKDYTTLYLNNMEPGQGTVEIMGIGNYVGKVYKDFNILSKLIPIPLANIGLEYNINEQIGVESSDWYTLTNNIQSDVGNYISVATLIDTENTKWADISTNPKTINWSISPKCLTYGMMEQIPNQEYSGDVKTPTIYVKHNEVLLIKGFDYNVSYFNNIEIGISTVKVTGIDRYMGTIEKVFSITGENISLPLLSKNLIYNGQDITGVFEGSGYTITGNVGKNAGAYTATATLIDATNTKWADLENSPKIISWSIGKAPLSVIINNFQIMFGDDVPTYDSRYEGFVLEDDDTSVTGIIEFKCDYIVKSNVGNYAITASGLESLNYGISYVDGNVIVNKKIISPPVAITGLIYNGEEQTGIQHSEEYVSSKDRAMNAGEYVALVTLNSNTTTSWEDGTTEERAVDWNIAPKSLSQEMICPICTQICIGSPVEPVAVKDDINELIEGDDYTVSYENNTLEGTATAVVAGIGNYTGKIQTAFDVLLGYLVKYDLNGFIGIAPESQALVSGSVLDLTFVAVPLSSGYTFIGWSLSSIGDAITEHIVTDNVTLYALWNNSNISSSANLIIEDGSNGSIIIIAMAVIILIDILLVYLIFVRRI